MKILMLAAAAASLIAGEASAYRFTPWGARFVMHGDVAITYKNLPPIQCALTLKGHVPPAHTLANIDRIKMAGAMPECAAFFFDPPWHMTAHAANLAVIHGFGMTGAGIGRCGSVVNLTPSGSQWSLQTGDRDCSMSGVLQATPALAIVP